MSSHVIIIPAHNRRATTLACLRHLGTTGDLGRFAVIVVDDGSTDGTSEAVRTEFPMVEILHGDGNLWWTGAIALGMQRAFESGAEAVCWLNDDCLPAPGTLETLFDGAGAAPGQIVAPACFNADTGEPVPNAFSGRNRVSVNAGKKRPADGLSGFCVVLPRAVWTRIGLPDARRFPHYYGDNAYTLTAARAGFSVMVLGTARAELTAYHAPPTLRALGERARGWREQWSRIFVSPKSPYRLRTLFEFQRLKHGRVRGTVLAWLRSGGWIVQALWPGGRG
jgi:GT2 family glycosyltransferase